MDFIDIQQSKINLPKLLYSIIISCWCDYNMLFFVHNENLVSKSFYFIKFHNHFSWFVFVLVLLIFCPRFQLHFQCHIYFEGVTLDSRLMIQGLEGILERKRLSLWKLVICFRFKLGLNQIQFTLLEQTKRSIKWASKENRKQKNINKILFVWTKITWCFFCKSFSITNIALRCFTQRIRKLNHEGYKWALFFVKVQKILHITLGVNEAKSYSLLVKISYLKLLSLRLSSAKGQ